MTLTEAQLGFYAANGYLVVENLVPEPILLRLRERISELQGANGSGAKVSGGIESSGGSAPTTAAEMRKLNELAPHEEIFGNVAASPMLTNIACALTDNARELMLYSDQVFLKPAFSGSAKPLHQDNSYFRVEPWSHGVTCWMAVDEATEENGCMRYIPGSHKLGLIPHRAISKVHLTPEREFDIEEEIPVPAKAGSCIFHHLLVLHSSGPNTSAKSRRAWALHYANRAATSAVKDWSKMIRMR